MLSKIEHFVDPRTKDEKWHIDSAKFIWEDWDQFPHGSFAKGGSRYNVNRLYSLGKQPNDIYKQQWQNDEDTNDFYSNINWDVVPVIDKYRRIILGKLSKLSRDDRVSAEAIDPLAMKEKREYESKEKANINLRDLFDTKGMDSSIFDSGEVDQPKNLEQLNIKMEFGYKHNSALDVEKSAEMVFAKNRFKELRGISRERLWDYGCAGYRPYFDPVDDTVKIRSIRIDRLVVSPTDDPYFRDISYAGEIIFLTIGEIRKANPKITDDELEELAQKFTGKYDNPNKANVQDATKMDSFKIPILDLEFFSVDRTYLEKRIDKRGNTIHGKTNFGTESNKNRSVSIEDNIVTRKVKWIIETDIAFDWGLKSDMDRRASRVWETKLDFFLASPELHNMETIGMTDRLIPLVDAWHHAYYKLLNVIQQARPKGLLIEIQALEDVSYGDGGETITPKDNINMYNQTGSLVFRKVGLDGEKANYQPITELNNGIGDEARRLFDVMNSYRLQINDMVGFNDITDGSTPDPRTLKGVANLASESTSNAIQYIVDAEISLYERLADRVAVMVHDLIAFKKNKSYENILGTEVMKSIGEDKMNTHREYGIEIEIRGDALQEERLNIKIDKALDQQQITPADATEIERIPNLKQRAMLLAYRVKEKTKQDEERALRLQEENGRIQQESATNTEKEKRTTKQLETEEDAKLIALQGEQDRETMAFRMEMEDRLESNRGSTKERIEDKRGQTQKDVAEIKKTTKEKVKV